MNAVDTNVLIYAHDPRDPKKQAMAISLIESLPDVVLLWQVACEYISVSKKLELFGYSRVEAWQDIQELRLVWDAVLPSWDVADRAQQLLDRYNLSYWDAMIVAACLETGVAKMYSEDSFGHDNIEGLELVNPFV
jgi:predicted nucleic acid-binding protein